MVPRWLSLVFQKRMLIILALGIASGLPLALSASTLQAWYATEGAGIVMIGFLGLVGQPYAFKFLWAPALDKYRLPYLGLRRGWLLTMQLALVGILILMGTQNPAASPYLLAFLAFCLALFSATQDIAIDAYRTELLRPEERGIGTSMAVTGYRVAMIVSTGLALVIAHYLGFNELYWLMAAVMMVGVIATLAGPEPVHPAVKKDVSLIQTCWLPFKEFLSRENALMLLALIILYKLGDAFAQSLVTTFLLEGVGFSLAEVGSLYKTVGLAATLVGVFVGGALMVRLGLYRSLLYFGILQALTNLLFFALAKAGPHYGLLISTVFLENFAGGLGTAAYMALVMSLCHPQFTATQFALLTALSAVGRVYVSPASGFLFENLGWPTFFIYSTLFALPGLLLLGAIRQTIQFYGNRSEQEYIQAGVEEAKTEA